MKQSYFFVKALQKQSYTTGSSHLALQKRVHVTLPSSRRDVFVSHTPPYSTRHLNFNTIMSLQIEYHFYNTI